MRRKEEGWRNKKEKKKGGLEQLEKRNPLYSMVARGEEVNDFLFSHCTRKGTMVEQW